MSWLTLLDLLGVFVFALSGGLDAAKYKLDILGVFFLAVATGLGGGIMRDVLLWVARQQLLSMKRILWCVSWPD
ncbi:TRIC cation channel family protein [Porticoccaceae bacterium]|nr:TRIC cation channel family protein [Porticoccaceae bacterium]